MIHDTQILPTPPTALLKAAHLRVRALFDDLASMETEEARRAAFRQIREALEIHLQIEETLFYPALLAHAGETAGDVVRESLEGHRELKRRLEKPAPDLARVVLEHFEQEEAELFPLARWLPVETQKELSHAMEALRTRLEWR